MPTYGRLLGSGGYGTVHTDPTDPTKCIKTMTYYEKEQPIRDRQITLDTIDPPDPTTKKRKYFGGKITDYVSVDPTLGIKKFKMVLQGESLNKIDLTQPKTITQLKTAFVNLLEGVCLLYDKGYSHNDIKMENIAYDEATNTLRIIDHDLFLAKHSEKRNFYFPDPPEVWLSKSHSQPNINRFKKIMTDGNFFTKKDEGDFNTIMQATDLRNVSPPVHWWNKELLNFLIKRQQPSYKEDLSNTDLYRLAVAAVELFKRDDPKLNSIIDDMIQPDPEKRIKPKDALKKWKEAITPKPSTAAGGVHVRFAPSPLTVSSDTVGIPKPPTAVGNVQPLTREQVAASVQIILQPVLVAAALLI